MATSPDSPVREHPAAAYHARRRSEVDAKILASARSILNEHGLAGMTVERVAADSGVAKTTIYRRFKHRYDMATAAIEDLPEVLTKDGPKDLPGQIKSLLTGLSADLDTRSAPIVGAGLVYRHDEDFLPLFRKRIIEARAEAMKPRLEAAVAAGTVRSDVSVELIVELINGLVVSGHLSGAAEQAGWVDGATKLVVSAISK